MKTTQEENIMPSSIDTSVLNDPELIRKRKEARRNMTDAERQALMSQAAERAFQEGYEKFKRESFEYLRKRREAKDRKKKSEPQS